MNKFTKVFKSHLRKRESFHFIPSFNGARLSKQDLRKFATEFMAVWPQVDLYVVTGLHADILYCDLPGSSNRYHYKGILGYLWFKLEGKDPTEFGWG